MISAVNRPNSNSLNYIIDIPNALKVKVYPLQTLPVNKDLPAINPSNDAPHGFNRQARSHNNDEIGATTVDRH